MPERDKDNDNKPKPKKVVPRKVGPMVHGRTVPKGKVAGRIPNNKKKKP